MKFIIDQIFLFGIVVLSGGALLWPALTMRGKRASALEATQMINRGKSIFLDVREPAEFSAGHMLDAKNIPFSELKSRIGELEKLKTKTIIVVCQKGTRSASAASVLKKAGFDAISLDGGLAAWQTQGLPIAK